MLANVGIDAALRELVLGSGLEPDGPIFARRMSIRTQLRIYNPGQTPDTNWDKLCQTFREGYRSTSGYLSGLCTHGEYAFRL